MNKTLTYPIIEPQKRISDSNTNQVEAEFLKQKHIRKTYPFKGTKQNRSRLYF